MSFNYLEIERIVGEISLNLPQKVKRVCVLDWLSVSGFDFADLSLGFELSNQKTIVFSFKQPWFGIFYESSRVFYHSKKNGSVLFGPSYATLVQKLENQVLLQIKAVPQERMAELVFESGDVFKADLIPARPNWSYSSSTDSLFWKNSTLSLPKSSPNPQLSGLTDRGVSYAYYLKARQKAVITEIRTRGLTLLTQKISKLQRAKNEVSEQEIESRQALKLKKWGELLKAVIHEHPKDFKAKKLTIFEQEVVLDAQKTLSENMALFFKRYKKLERTAAEVEIRKKVIAEQLEKQIALKAELLKEPGSEFDFAAELDVLRRFNLIEVGDQKKAGKSKKWEKSGLRHYQSKEGFAVWVGKNHKENEELVIRLARGNDVWMHLKGRPGAHVVIQLPREKTPSLETLLDGAFLAAFYSGVKEGDKVEIDYTQRKNVKRVSGKGADQFLVTYNQNKTLVIKFEKKRAEEILAR